MADDQLADLLAFAQRWNKKARQRVVFDPSDDVLMPGVVPVGITAVDEAFGGGVPRGHTTIIIGEPSSGKTLLAQLVIAGAQRAGGTAIFFDAERTFDPRWFKVTGVDVSHTKLAVVRPRSLEQAFDMVVDALETTKPDVLVVDSIPALVPAAVMDAQMTEQDFRGVHPRKITEGVSKATQYNDTTALIFINQLRTAMNVKFGNPESMPGGRALRHHAALIIRARRGKWLTDAGGDGEGEASFTSLDEEAKRVGFMLKLRVEKSKVSPTTWQEAELKFYFTGEVDPLGSLIHLAIIRGVITGERGYYEVPGVKGKLHGLPALENLLRGDDVLKAKLVELIRKST